MNNVNLLWKKETREVLTETNKELERMIIKCQDTYNKHSGTTSEKSLCPLKDASRCLLTALQKIQAIERAQNA